MELIAPSAWQLVVMACTVFVAYGVFGFSGFGAILVALPVLLVSDLFAALLLGWRSRAQVDKPELLKLLPFAVVGMVIGTVLLLRSSEGVLLTALGLFVLGLSLWNLSGRASTQPVSALWVLPAGVVGGTFSSMFGTGGAVYTMFLARRLRDTSALRATVGAVILVSALVRLGLFTSNGFFDPAGVLQLAFTLLPFSVAGFFVGSRVNAKASQDRVRRVIWMLLVFSGASVLLRGLMQL